MQSKKRGFCFALFNLSDIYVFDKCAAHPCAARAPLFLEVPLIDVECVFGIDRSGRW